ncbi:hypothetical protein PR048_020789 [Dryococelus australis]|uniref:Uncharacterized protein n=1 Tax=Dryococelus australis TaxID=614101 RepID=A0ABQ9GWG6_9NEOP|nr:hypothetical protein PR048_020789 [Dryococelus australis]
MKNFKNHLQKCSDPYKMLLILRTAPCLNGLSPAELLLAYRGGIQHQKNNFDSLHVAKTLTELHIGSNIFISDRSFLQPLRNQSDQTANRIPICGDDTET